jgi:hypothetical protein
MERVEEPSAFPGDRKKNPLARWLVATGVVSIVGLAILAFFLSIYAVKGSRVPMGWDTSEYVWRTALARSIGVADLDGALPRPAQGQSGRPGFVVVAAALASTEGVSPFRIAAVLPAVAAAAVGLAAGAFMSATLRRPWWESVVVALVVGTSASVVRLAGPETYQDNLLGAAVFMAAAIPVVGAVDHRAGLVPAITLLASGGVIHWMFFLYMAGVLGVVGMAYLPASVDSWRRGEQSLLDTPAARMAEVIVGAGAIAAGLLYGVLSAATRSSFLSVEEFMKKFRRDLPKYQFTITLPVAAFGAAWLAWGAAMKERVARRPRLVLALLLAWCGIGLAGSVALVAFQLQVPAHRFVAFAMALPVLAAVGLVALGRLAWRWAPPLGIAVVSAGLLGGSLLSHEQWSRTRAWMDPAKIDNAAAAAGYLDFAEVDDDRPIVVIVGRADRSYIGLMGQMVRAAMPAERIDDVYVYYGDPELYLQRRPTDVPRMPGTPDLSQVYFGYLQHTYDQNPVAVVLSEFGPEGFEEWARTHPESLVAEGVAVVRGPIAPAPASLSASSPVTPYGTARLALLGVGALVLLGSVGLGWSVVLLGRTLRPAELVAVAPAVGIAMLVVVGVFLDRLGLRLTGAGGISAPVLSAATAWVIAWTLRRRNRKTPPSGDAATAQVPAHLQ